MLLIMFSPRPGPDMELNNYIEQMFDMGIQKLD